MFGKEARVICSRELAAVGEVISAAVNILFTEKRQEKLVTEEMLGQESLREISNMILTRL
jgi:hypothetical protein